MSFISIDTSLRRVSLKDRQAKGRYAVRGQGPLLKGFMTMKGFNAITPSFDKEREGEKGGEVGGVWSEVKEN